MDEWDMDDWPTLPREAYADAGTSEFKNDWIERASPPEQIAAMVEWFTARFEDPAMETPYMGSEGGYQWIFGGPYDALEEIGDRFGGFVDDKVIEFAADYVVNIDGVWEWAPTNLTSYDAQQDVVVDDQDLPLQELSDRIDHLLEVLDLKGSARAVEMAKSLAYAGLISALETFLWETMAYWVANDKQTVHNLVKKSPLFKDKEIKLGSIFEAYEGLEKRIRSHMQRMAWHRWEEASRFIQAGLEVDVPSFKQFHVATTKRHDIVHRSGRDVEGNPVQVSVDEVRALATSVHQFAIALHELIARAKQPAEHRFDAD